MAPPCSPSVVDAGPYVFISDRIPFDGRGGGGDDWGARIRQMFDGLGKALASASLEPEDIFKMAVWLRPETDRAAFDVAYVAFFGAYRPARSMLDAALTPDGSVLEIEVICFRAT